MNSLFDRLQLGIAAQREFSGNVAHELRTPIASIRLQAEHALTLASDVDSQTRLKKLLASTDHASHLIDQLLALAFADEAQSSVALVPLDLKGTVSAVMLRHLHTADRLGVDFGAEGLDDALGSDTPCKVMGNAGLVEAVLDNLLDNAFRYGLSPLGSKITVALERNEGAVLLRVVDNGKGLTDAQIEAFQLRWHQAEHTYKLGAGVGLGLSIVSRYAQLLNADFSLVCVGSDGLCAQLKFKDELPSTI